MPFLWETYWIA